MPQYLADNSYLAIKPEATEGVAVIPSNFVPLVSESIKTIVNYNADRRMKGINWKSDELIRQGNRSHEGEIVVLGDPDTLGHFLNMVMLKGSTTGDAANGYTHPFTVGAPKSYTIEIKKGLYTQRYVGVKIDELKLDFVDGQLQISASVKAMGQFSVGSVGVALTGAGMTSLVFDDEYDVTPNRGLVIGDVITVGGVDITLTSVNANGTTVGFTSITVTAAIGTPVYLKPQTVSLPTLQDPFYFGNALIGFDATAAAALTNAGSQSLATKVFDFSIVLKNNLFAQNGSNRLDPILILPRTKEAQISLKQLFESVAQRQAWLDKTKQAIVAIIKGKFIKADFSTQETLTLTFNKVKLTDNDNKIEIGEFIIDDQKFEALYDSGDAQAMSGSLVNRTAGTSY